MRHLTKALIIPLVLTGFISMAQPRGGFTPQAVKDPLVDAIVKEATENSQLENLAHQLLDNIGPRLVGTPEMQKAGDWAIATYKEWGIPARSEKWGEWRGWQRGPAHIDMVHPRVRTLEGMQLAWSPGTGGKAVTGEVVTLPDVADSAAFKAWLPSVKGKFVMISVNQPTGRPDYNWDEFGTKESIEKMKKERDQLTDAWNRRVSRTGYNARTLPVALENAGAAGVLMCYWSRGFGANKIFGANTKKVPTLDLSLEDYGMLFRLAESGSKPKITVKVDSKELPPAPAFNIIGEIKGSEKPGEYVILSAHFDSWDGATGATDNGTGTLVMMEAMRILKKILPNPKRTILVGHWGSEEQGLNGSRAFVEDNPGIVENMQALFNQDNGTGRVVNISGQGFLHAYDYLGRWLSHVPGDVRKHIETNFPGSPGGGGSDYASFVAAGAPAFSLSSNSWSYGSYTWHTNRDTYDKVVFDDVRNNVILTAVLAYMASEDPKKTSRERIVLPVNPRTGQPGSWPAQTKPTRRGGLD
ncbi:MAG TPA: M20/M25/M40 family metallo-hydrolase [Chitinophagaceae bacterium]|nr:M20/M25/M40 family metallo-hydrolase [Chitinophagaceae bacterium]